MLYCECKLYHFLIFMRLPSAIKVMFVFASLFAGFFIVGNAHANTVQITGHVYIDQNQNGKSDFSSDPFVGSSGSDCERSKTVEGVRIQAMYTSGTQIVEPDTCSSEIFTGFSTNHANYVIDGVPRGEFVTLKLITPAGWQSAFDEISGFKAGDTAGTSFMIVQQSEPLYQRFTVDGVTYPRHGQVVTRGESMYITWRSRGVEKVKLQYGSGSIIPNEDTVIAELDSNLGYYEWDVPSNLVPGEFDYFIRMSDVGNSSVWRDSSKFTIVPGSDERVVAVLTPNGGEQYHLNNIQDIRWSTTGQSDSVRISAIVDDCGSSYGVSCSQGTEYLINVKAPNTGKYAWRVGEDFNRGSIPTGSYKIKIKDLSTDAEDQSDIVFNIIEQEVTTYDKLSNAQYGYSINYPSSATYYETNTSNEIDSIGRLQRTVFALDNVIDDVIKHSATFQVSVYKPEKYSQQKQFVGDCSGFLGFDCNHGFVTVDGGVVEFREITQDSEYNYYGLVRNNSYVYTIFFGDEKNEQVKNIVHEMVGSLSIPNYADYVITDITFNPAFPIAGKQVVATATVKNQGGSRVPDGMRKIDIKWRYDRGVPNFLSGGSLLEFPQPGEVKTLRFLTQTFQAGIYDFIFAIESEDGDTANNSIQKTLTVIDPADAAQAVPVVSLISPSEGKAGSSVTVEIVGSNFTGACELSGCGVSPVSSKGLKLTSARFVSDSKILASYRIFDDAIAGTRMITVATEAGQSNKMPFKVISENVEEQKLNILSPNGSIIWTVGKKQEIVWEAEGFNNLEKVQILLLKPDCTNCAIQTVETVTSGVDANTRSFFWTIPSSVIPGKDYLIRIISGGVSDASDRMFTIEEGQTDLPVVKDEPYVGPPPSCLQNNTLIKLPDDPKIYIVENCKRRWIQTLEEFNREGHKFEEVKKVDAATLEKHEDIKKAVAQIKEIVAELVRAANDERVYRVVQGKRLWIPTAEVFNRQRLDWGAVQETSSAAVNNIPTVRLVRTIGDKKVYYLTGGGQKRHVPSAEVFESYGNSWDDVLDVDPDIVNAYKDNELIRHSGQERVYKLEGGKKRWIKSGDAFGKKGYKWEEVGIVNDEELASYPDGTPIE